MNIKSIASCLIVVGLFLASSVWASAVKDGTQDDWVPSGKGYGMPHANAGQELVDQKGGKPNDVTKAPAGFATVKGNGINYHGGPLITSSAGTKVYYIWYGNWAGNTATTILNTLAGGIAPSPYFNINTTYYNGSNVHVTNLVTFGGGITNNYTYGTTLSDAQVQSVVTDSIASGQLPKDPNAVYFVLTSQDVNESSGFCTQYCGWHSVTSFSSVDVKYAFVGNPQRCPNSCEAQTTSPNGNPGADGMASVIAHELEEAVTDPNLNAWYDTRGYENADKCAWKFGTTYAAGGGVANMKLGGLNFLIQQNWVNAGGGRCALSF